tara:strand:- start:143 stop:511 length:369 start_codon:yes stop_codon:yes gene_type:complete
MRLVVAILATFFVASTSLAQQSEPTPNPQIPAPQNGFPIALTVMCDTVDKMSAVLEARYNEVPIATGTGLMMTQGQALSGTMLMWGNPESKTYSITMDNGKIMCMLLTGKEFGPVKPKGEDL